MTGDANDHQRFIIGLFEILFIHLSDFLGGFDTIHYGHVEISEDHLVSETHGAWFYERVERMLTVNAEVNVMPNVNAVQW